MDEPGFWERAFLVCALLDQQDAFLNIPRVLQGRDASDSVGVTSDPINVILVAVTLVGLFFLILKRPEPFLAAISRNIPILALSGLIFVSSLWSVAMGLSAKRAVVHLNTILLALYLATRMDFDAALRCVALSIAVAAVASLVAGFGFHSIGVMHTPGLEGRWRGVYSHKNPLGQAMGLGVLLETYFLAQGRGRRENWLHGLLLLLEAFLIIKANSVTILSIVAISLTVFCGYLLVRREGYLRRAVLVLAPLGVGAAAAAIAMRPDLIQAILGRDTSLSGRTELWSGVVHAISLRPLLGYGYQSFWDGGEPLAYDIWAAIHWNAPNSHSGWLEVLLSLGAFGLMLTLIVLVQALVRAARLTTVRATSMKGVVALILLGGIVMASMTEAVLIRQGDIDWLMVNLVSFACLQLWLVAGETSGEVERNIMRRARPTFA